MKQICPKHAAGSITPRLLPPPTPPLPAPPPATPPPCPPHPPRPTHQPPGPNLHHHTLTAHYYRRTDQSSESTYRVWPKAPGVMVIDEGSTMVERRLTERVTILSDNNDAVTLDIDVATPLPRRRTFEWRNAPFKDRDEDAEEYDDSHTIQGLPTA